MSNDEKLLKTLDERDEARATIATLTAERDALKVKCEKGADVVSALTAARSDGMASAIKMLASVGLIPARGDLRLNGNKYRASIAELAAMTAENNALKASLGESMALSFGYEQAAAIGREQCATITAERDSLKAQVEWAQAANNGWQKSNATLAAQVAVLRDALERVLSTTLPVHPARHFCECRACITLRATAADFDCIVEVAKEVVMLHGSGELPRHIDDKCDALTPKAREMLR